MMQCIKDYVAVGVDSLRPIDKRNSSPGCLRDHLIAALKPVAHCLASAKVVK